jgi:hypothetical protein
MKKSNAHKKPSGLPLGQPILSLIEHIAVNLRAPVILWGPGGVGKFEGMAQLVAKQ